MSDPFANNDPFAANDSAPADPWSEPRQEAPAGPGNTVTLQSAGKISVTLKQHAGFDSPWIVLYSDTPEEAKAMLAELLKTELPNAVAVTAQRFSATRGGDGASQAAPRPSRPQQQQPAQQAQSLPPGVEQRSCAHGPMVFKSGMNKWNKPYNAFFCPTPQGTPDQCKAIFL